jgi:predicted trehalose synthase
MLTMLDCLLLERSVYEMRYELENRQAWLPVALEGLRATVLGGISG